MCLHKTLNKTQSFNYIHNMYLCKGLGLTFLLSLIWPLMAPLWLGSSSYLPLLPSFFLLFLSLSLSPSCTYVCEVVGYRCGSVLCMWRIFTERDLISYTFTHLNLVFSFYFLFSAVIVRTHLLEFSRYRSNAFPSVRTLVRKLGRN